MNFFQKKRNRGEVQNMAERTLFLDLYRQKRIDKYVKEVSKKGKRYFDKKGNLISKTERMNDNLGNEKKYVFLLLSLFVPLLFSVCIWNYCKQKNI